MTSPALKRHIKRELVDRARFLIKVRGQKVFNNPAIANWVRIGDINIRNGFDGHLTIVRGRKVLLTCSGKSYRFGRDPAAIEEIIDVLKYLRSEMVLDDLSDI